MNTETEQVLQAALALREDERDELVEALPAAKNDSTEPLFDSVMLEDFRRRSAEIDSAHFKQFPGTRPESGSTTIARAIEWLRSRSIPSRKPSNERALAWYLDRSPQAAARFEAAFDEAVEAVRSRPTFAPTCDDLHRFVLLGRFPYSLIYRWNGDSAK